MSEATAAAAVSPPTDGSPATKPTQTAVKKVTLLDMIVWAETEISDVDIWETSLKAEGKPLYAKMAVRRDMMRRIVRTLELVKTHEAGFLKLINATRASAKQ